MEYVWVHCPSFTRPWIIIAPDGREVFWFVADDREYMFEVLERLNHPDLLENEGDPDELAILFNE